MLRVEVVKQVQECALTLPKWAKLMCILFHAVPIILDYCFLEKVNMKKIVLNTISPFVIVTFQYSLL